MYCFFGTKMYPKWKSLLFRILGLEDMKHSPRGNLTTFDDLRGEISHNFSTRPDRGLVFFGIPGVLYIFLRTAKSRNEYMGVSKNSGTPKWMVKIMEIPIKMDDLGVPLFSETPIYDIERFEPYSCVCSFEIEDLFIPHGTLLFKKVSLCITRFWWSRNHPLLRSHDSYRIYQEIKGSFTMWNETNPSSSSQQLNDAILGGGFKHFFLFIPIWANDPSWLWLLCFKWVETTN